MLQRIIPSSKEQLPVIGLGTYQTFNVPSTQAQIGPLTSILHSLSHYQGSIIDSSPMYGSSEQIVGDLIRGNNLENCFFLATKVWTKGKGKGIEEMNRSFKRMATDRIDLMQIHNLLDWQTHLPTLRDWKEKGKIRYIGITHYHESAYADVEQILLSEPLDFLQINYSLAKREAEKRLLSLAAEKGIAVIANQPFEAGALFSKVKNKNLPEYASEFECTTWAQFFLKFILSHPAITCVIPATSKPDHFMDFIQAGTGKLPDAKMRIKMVESFRNL